MMDAGELTCTVTIEELRNTGEVIKKTQHRNLTLTLGRDSFNDMVLRVSHSKKTDKFPLKEVLIHKKFVREGKATVKLPDHKIQFLLCNCPPDKLIVFLKTLSTKLECLRDKGFTSMRKKLLSDIPVSFQEISPLTIKDVKAAHACKQKENNIPPEITKGGIKRKRTVDSETKPNSLLATVLCKKLKSETVLNMKPSLSVLNKAQTAVLEAVLRRKNIFFTGSAGTGKTFLMKRIIGALPPQHTFATASTGVAACQIGGTTVHAFAGMGSGQAPIQQCIELASRPQIAQQWKKCHHLIIDEISMVDGDFFDKLETIARVVRQNDEPFGGIQLIVCGDFLQLPPVVRDEKKRKFAFQSRAWHKCIQVNLELEEVRRQSDKHFIEILQHIRHGRCPEYVVNTLKATSKNVIHQDGIQATRLCTHKEDVEEINKHHLHKLIGDTHTFIATDSDSIYRKQLDNLCPVKGQLVLKNRAQVILAKNLDIHKGLVNGARGVITGFEQGNEGFPIVKFVCGVEEVIKPVHWAMKAGSGLCLMRKQIPLKLAWAISIHKSQGMSLDCVEISLSRVFESGQAYVALSRAKSLQGLRVVDFNKGCVRANPEVLKFYHKLNLTQRMLQSHMGDFQLPVAPTRGKH